MTRAIACLLLASCLSEPGRPGGSGSGSSSGSGAASLHPQTVVADVDGDGYDDLIVWGHDTNASDGSDAAMFVYFGGLSGLATPMRVSLMTFDDAPDSDTADQAVVWTEPVTMSSVSTGAASDVVALIGRDVTPPPRVERYDYVQRWSFANRVPSVVHSGNPPLRALGAYATDSAGAYAIQRQTSGGPDEIVVGDPSSVFVYPDDIDAQTGPTEPNMTHPYGNATLEAGMFAMPRPSAGVEQDLVEIAEAGVYVTTGSDTAGLEFAGGVDIARGSNNPRLARAGRIASTTSEITTCAFNQYLAIVEISAGSPSFWYLLVQTTNSSDVTDIALADFGGMPNAVTIEENTLFLYQDLALGSDDTTATPANRSTMPIDPSYDLLAIGNFDGTGDQIDVLSTTDLGETPACFTATAGVLASCD
ncbi:MAG TPA: hypothetical protein VGG28_29515 [Kofleriaceae bacterium]|jgi:hypothetical protein